MSGNILIPIKKDGFSPVQNLHPSLLDEAVTTASTLYVARFVRRDPRVLTKETDLASLFHGFGWTREGTES